MNENIVKEFFEKEVELVRKGICPICKKDIIEEFYDKISEQEFKISGLCQQCQDAVFGE